MTRTFIFDIDGVVCETKKGDYKKAKPKKGRIEKINKLYDNGNTIVFFTSRGKMTGIDWSKLTHYQFKRWKLKHHDIIFGKPFGDLYVDDRGMNDKDFFKLK